MVKACEDALGIEIGQSTADGRFFLREFECLGACANAPILWVDDDYYEDLTYDSAKAIIEALKRGERPERGLAGRAPGLDAGAAARPRCWRIPTATAERRRRSRRARRGAGREGQPEAEVKEHAVRPSATAARPTTSAIAAWTEPKDADAG